MGESDLVVVVVVGRVFGVVAVEFLFGDLRWFLSNWSGCCVCLEWCGSCYCVVSVVSS